MPNFTLLEVLVQQVQKIAPAYLALPKELAHVPEASKGDFWSICPNKFLVSLKKISADLTQMKSKLKLLEKEIAKTPNIPNDKFKEVMNVSISIIFLLLSFQKFHNSASASVKHLEQSHSNMQHLLHETMEYLVEDSLHSSSEEFFSQVNNFVLIFEVRTGYFLTFLEIFPLLIFSLLILPIESSEGHATRADTG